MREITTHVENDRQPKLFAGEAVAPGNAPQYYEIEVEGTKIPVQFINLEENGVTNEVLLAIVIDRLEGFQAGPFACEENAEALSFSAAALTMLKQRSKERSSRGVENTHSK